MNQEELLKTIYEFQHKLSELEKALKTEDDEKEELSDDIEDLKKDIACLMEELRKLIIREDVSANSQPESTCPEEYYDSRYEVLEENDFN